MKGRSHQQPIWPPSNLLLLEVKVCTSSTAQQVSFIEVHFQTNNQPVWEHESLPSNLLRALSYWNKQLWATMKPELCSFDYNYYLANAKKLWPRCVATYKDISSFIFCKKKSGKFRPHFQKQCFPQPEKKIKISRLQMFWHRLNEQKLLRYCPRLECSYHLWKQRFRPDH